MWRMLALVVLVAVSGCDDEPAIKIGDVCDRIGTAFCNRVLTCGLDTFNACFQPFKQGCCLNTGQCDEQAGVDEAWMQRCERALPGHSCQELNNAVLPAACLMN
jgi:hypothetical protein